MKKEIFLTWKNFIRKISSLLKRKFKIFPPKKMSNNLTLVFLDIHGSIMKAMDRGLWNILMNKLTFLI